MNVIIRCGALNIKLEELRSQLQTGDALHFSSYEELAGYCYPFSKKLAKGITDEQKYWLLYYIAYFFHQHVLMYANCLGYAHFLKDVELHIVNDWYWGKNGTYKEKRIIALNPIYVITLVFFRTLLYMNLHILLNITIKEFFMIYLNRML